MKDYMERVKLCGTKDPTILKHRKECDEAGSRRTSGPFQVVGDYLWRTSLGYHQLVIPDSKTLKHLLLHEAHDVAHAGHMGRHKTYEKLSRRVWWPGMYADTEGCQGVKGSRRQGAKASRGANASLSAHHAGGA